MQDPKGQSNDSGHHALKLVNFLGAGVAAALCFGFRNDVQEAWLRVVLLFVALTTLLWAAFQFIRR
jgi:hypothetical protein